MQIVKTNLGELFWAPISEKLGMYFKVNNYFDSWSLSISEVIAALKQNDACMEYWVELSEKLVLILQNANTIWEVYKALQLAL